MNDKSSIPPGGQFLVYQTEDGKLKIDVRFQGETVWLSLKQFAELFQRDKSVISRHIKNVFDEGELRPEGTVAKSATVQTEGGKQVTREIEFFNLDMIISVGYRVKSVVATGGSGLHNTVSVICRPDPDAILVNNELVASMKISPEGEW